MNLLHPQNPTNHLRFLHTPMGILLEQLFVNDNQSRWEWRVVPTVGIEAPSKGEGPPPV